MVWEGVGCDVSCSMSLLKRTRYVMRNSSGGVWIERYGFFDEFVELGRLENIPSFLNIAVSIDSYKCILKLKP